MTFETIDLFALAPSAGPGADRIDRYWSLVEKCLHKNPNLTLDSSDYASLLQRMLGNFEAYPLVNAYAPGGEEWRTCVESKALHRAIARLINLRPSGTAGGKPFNYKFLVPPDFSDLDNLFQLLAKREGIGDGFYLVSGPRGSGKSQLLRDMERKLKTHHTSVQSEDENFRPWVLRIDLGIEEQDHAKLVSDLLEHIAVHAVELSTKVYPEMLAKQGKFGWFYRLGAVGFHMLMASARWLTANGALWLGVLALSFLWLGTSVLPAVNDVLSWSEWELVLATDSRFLNGTYAYQAKLFFLGLLFGGGPIILSFRAISRAWDQPRPPDESLYRVRMAWGGILFISGCAAAFFFIYRFCENFTTFSVAAFSVVALFCLIFSLRPQSKTDIRRPIEQARKAVYRMLAYLLMAVTLIIFLLSQGREWSALWLLIPVWLGINAAHLVLRCPNYWKGYHFGRKVLVELLRRKHVNAIPAGLSSALGAILPTADPHGTIDRSAAILQMELEQLLQRLGEAFERAYLLIDDVDVLESPQYKQIMRIFRGSAKTKNLTTVMSVPTLFWHAYRGPYRNDINSTIRGFWLLGDPDVFSLAERTQDCIVGYETVGKIMNRWNEASYLMLPSQIVLRSNADIKTMLRKILNQRRELGKWQGPDPAQEDPGLHPLDPVHILLGGLPTNTHDLQKLAVIFSSSIREWIRYLVKRLPTSEGQIDLRWHVGVDTGLPWEAPWIIDPMAHPVKVAASRAEWELCYKKVLENDWNSENLLDRELAFKCDS